MSEYIKENGKDVELTEEKIAEIIKDTEYRVAHGTYQVIYDSSNDSSRSKPLLQKVSA